MPSLLHVGCGTTPLPTELEGYTEVRLDIDPDVGPDVVGSMTDMGDIGRFDAVYTAHGLEHLYPYEVPLALEEFRRVLKPGGTAIIIVPDLQDIPPTEAVLYESLAGPVTGLDMFYGMARLINPSRTYMAHHCGFVRETLERALHAAGFAQVQVLRTGSFNLVGVAVRP